MTPDAAQPQTKGLAAAQADHAPATPGSRANSTPGVTRHTERTQSVFAYGILMRPDILAAITGRAPRLVPARLPGFRRYGLPHPDGEIFAAIAPTPGHEVAGVLILGVTDAELAAFDRVEEIGTGYYVREPVQARIAEQTAPMPALAYVCGPSRRHSLAGDWQPVQFDAAKAAAFIRDRLPALLG